MKIIILGAGEVGTGLVEYLIDEKELRDIVQRELGKMESYTNLLFN